MLDPLGSPPAWLQEFVEPFALKLSSPTLSVHAHEVVLAFVFYQVIHSFVSPWLSPILFPQSYPKLSPRTKLNWDIHVVSLVQSVLINVIALWIMYVDEERWSMSPAERVFGYTGACGFIQALAVGYFVYDLIVSAVHIKMFGIGMLFHAISALWVFSLGFVSLIPCRSLALPDLTCLIGSETFPQLLRSHIHSLRALQPIPEYSLVP